MGDIRKVGIDKAESARWRDGDEPVPNAVEHVDVLPDLDAVPLDAGSADIAALDASLPSYTDIVERNHAIEEAQDDIEDMQRELHDLDPGRAELSLLFGDDPGEVSPLEDSLTAPPVSAFDAPVLDGIGSDDISDTFSQLAGDAPELDAADAVETGPSWADDAP